MTNYYRRRMVALAICFFALVLFHCSLASSASAGSFSAALTAITAASDAVQHFTKRISESIGTVQAGFDNATARQTHARLVDMSARASALLSTKNANIVGRIDQYLKRPSAIAWSQVSSSGEWKQLSDSIESTLRSLKQLLGDLKAERSDFVLEDAYKTMLRTLDSRAVILSNLRSAPEPQSDEDREALRRLNLEYKRLMSQFEIAITQLNAYVLSTKPN